MLSSTGFIHFTWLLAVALFVVVKEQKQNLNMITKALHTELELEYLSRNLRTNKFFAKIKVQFWRDKFLIYFAKHKTSQKERFGP